MKNYYSYLRVYSTGNFSSSIFYPNLLSLEHVSSRVSGSVLKVKSFWNWILTNEKPELVIKICQWNCTLHNNFTFHNFMKYINEGNAYLCASMSAEIFLVRLLSLYNNICWSRQLKICFLLNKSLSKFSTSYDKKDFKRVGILLYGFSFHCNPPPRIVFK